jgi:hypothetical protein
MIVYEGEPIVLKLSSKYADRPLPTGEFRGGDFFMRGKKIVAKRSSVLQTAMQMFQEEVGDLAVNGGLVARNTYRQWYVYRDGKLIRLADLKDPALAHTRGQAITLEDLGL